MSALTDDEKTQVRQLICDGVRTLFPEWRPDNIYLQKALSGILDSVERMSARNEHAVELLRKALQESPRLIVLSTREPLRQAILHRVGRVQSQCNDALRIVGYDPWPEPVPPTPEAEPEFRLLDLRTAWERLLDVEDL